MKKMVIKVRYNQNVAGVPVPICDSCWEGFCTDCEGGNCTCQWTHYGEDWDELNAEILTKGGQND